VHAGDLLRMTGEHAQAAQSYRRALVPGIRVE
jgi:hypothetical protein